MAQHADAAASLPSALFQVRATAGDDLPLGARLPAPWPVVLFVLVTSAIVGAWSQIEVTPARVQASRTVDVVERSGTSADALAPEWVFDLETRSFDGMVRDRR